jgi:Protein of unknown function (DUF2442)
MTSDLRRVEIEDFAKVTQHAAELLAPGQPGRLQAVVLGEHLGASHSTVEKWLFGVAAPRGLAAVTIKSRLESIAMDESPSSGLARDAIHQHVLDLVPGEVPPWHAVSVRAMPGFLLRVRFADGREGSVDLSTKVKSVDAGPYAALLPAMEFIRPTVSNGDITWPSGVVLNAQAIYDGVVNGNGTWRP